MASSTSSVDNQLANHSTWRIASSLPERDELPSVLCQPLTANPTSKEEPSEITISLRSRDSTKRLRTRKSIKRLPSYTPRPPNAWILYRSEQIRILKDDSGLSRKPQSEISKLIGFMWRDESLEVKKYYEDEAASRKLEHMVKYPDYQYLPVRKDKIGEGPDESPRRKRTNTKDIVPPPSPPEWGNGLPEIHPLQPAPAVVHSTSYDPAHCYSQCIPIPHTVDHSQTHITHIGADSWSSYGASPSPGSSTSPVSPSSWSNSSNLIWAPQTTQEAGPYYEPHSNLYATAPETQQDHSQGWQDVYPSHSWSPSSHIEIYSPASSFSPYPPSPVDTHYIDFPAANEVQFWSPDLSQDYVGMYYLPTATTGHAADNFSHFPGTVVDSYLFSS